MEKYDYTGRLYPRSDKADPAPLNPCFALETEVATHTQAGAL